MRVEWLHLGQVHATVVTKPAKEKLKMEHSSSFLPTFLQKKQVISVLSVVMILLTLGVSVVFTRLHSAHAANALTWSSDTLIGQTSPRSPAMAAFNNKLSVAYVRDLTGGLYVTTSSDGTNWSPSTFTNLYTTIGVSPALAVYNNKLYMAYVSADGYALLVTSSSDGMTWSDGIPVSDVQSSTTPSLAVFNNQLYVADVANDGSGRVVINSSSDGINWSRPILVSNSSSTQYSDTAPSLAVYNNKLYVAFVAHNGSGDVLIASYDGTGWSNDTKINQGSQAAPALTVFQNELFLAFADNGKNDHLLYVSSDGTNWSADTWVPNQYTHDTPAIAVLNNKLYIAFLSNNNSGDLLIVSGS
jgi:hypothetical protein